MGMEGILLIIGGGLALFLIVHMRPLSKDEAEALARKRREKQVRSYFTFDHDEYEVDPNFKKRMNPNGSYYPVSEELKNFPSVAAALLKYKKHEWIIVGFEKDKKVLRCWLNKGIDRSCVSPHLSPTDIVKNAKASNYRSVLIFHNHPNSSPNEFDCRNPSEADIKSAKEFASTLNENGINLVEFICERGRHYEYYHSWASDFYPLADFRKAVEFENGKTLGGNLSMHLERMF